MDQILPIVALFVPLVIIIWLANFADRQRERGDQGSAQVLSILTYALLVLTYLAFLFGGLALQALGALLAGPQAADLAETWRTMGLDPEAMIAAIPRVGTGLWVSALLGLILLLRPVRALFGRFTRIDPNRTVHAVALSYIALVLLNLLVTIGFGLGNLATLTEIGNQATGPTNPAPGIWAQEIILALLGAIGVGLLSRRTLRETLARLAIVAPSLRQVVVGVLIGLGMVPVVLALEWLGNQFGVGFNADVERLSEQLIGPLGESIPGILTLGLAAALGEETVFRGALQPRFGLIFTSLLFALLHSTYGLTLSTLLVLVVGLVLGIVRQRANTSTTMIIHAVYNMSLGLITYLNLMPGP